MAGGAWWLGAPLLLAAAVPLALWVDRAFGEPALRWHPVAWMGRYLGWAGRQIAPAQADDACAVRDLPRFLAGAGAWLLGALVAGAAAGALQALVLRAHPALAVVLLALLLKPLLAWRMLRDEVLAVEAALAESLPAGRARLARLVSRDVAGLSASEVRESAIESLAENLNDSVVAPLFWFALLGLPGAAVYRFANTADAMWGYRGRWEWAGKWAARADDVLSWVPARLAAGLLWAVAGRGRWKAVPVEARRTPSPNSGWPMAAMALALGVRLAKPGVYTLNASGRPAQPADTIRALVYAGKSVLAQAAIALLALLLIAWAQAG